MVHACRFDPMVKDILPSIVPDGFIYLRAQPDLCSTRMALRNRSEESSVPLEYLQMLHDKHEDWLAPNFTQSRPWVSACCRAVHRKALVLRTL